MEKALKRVAITGGAGQIAYSLLFRIASGEMFGQDTPIALHILEVPDALKMLEGVKMELQDCAYPLLREIQIGSDPFELFRGVHCALLIGAKPRGPGMERGDLLKDNGKIFVQQGKALDKCADRDVKVLVVGNPCNTNCLIAMSNAPNIPKQNFHAMTRLDQNRAVAQIAQKTGVPISEVSNMTIWGNHSSTQVPDFFNAKIQDRSLLEKIADRPWLESQFINIVQKRGAAIIEARGKSSAASAAHAIIESIRSLYQPTPKGEWFSSGVYSGNNPYGISEGLIFSFPCRSKGRGDCEIVRDIPWNDFLKSRIQASQKELLEERQLVAEMVGKEFMHARK